jgi:HK97 family phage major capsid protein
MKGQVAIPESSEELEELLNDDGRLQDVLAAGQFSDFTKAYMAQWTRKNDDMVAQFRDQMQIGMQQFLQEQEQQGARPAAGFRGGPALTGREARRARAVARSKLGAREAERQVERQKLFSDSAIGAGVDDEEYGKSLGAFIHCVYLAEYNAQKRGDTEAIAKYQGYKTRLHNALSERIPAEGGFLIPENLRSEVLMVALESAIVRPRATVIPMDSLRVPIPAIDDTSHSSSVYGGVVGYWTEEGAALTASAPSFQRIVLEAKKLTAYTTIPNELLQDSVTSLDTWFNMFFPRAISWFEDVAFIGSSTTGTGVGEPQGFLNAPCAIKVAAGSDNKIWFADIASAFARMWPPSLRNAVWLCSPDVLPWLIQLAMTGGNTTADTTVVAPPLFLQGMQAIGSPGDGNGDGVGYTLMGRPLIVSEKMPSSASGNTTTAGALALVDLSYYLIGDRQSMQVASSDQYLFANDLMAYRIIQRLDGRAWLQSAITPENGSANTLSPFVLIDTTS